MKNEDKFFEGIEDTLHAYEDAYMPGAWETFQQKRNRKRLSVWFVRAGSAAAVLLLAGYAAFLFMAKTPDTVQFAANKKTEKKSATQPEQSSASAGEVNQAPVSSKLSNSLSQQSQIAVTGKLAPSFPHVTASQHQITIIATAKTNPEKLKNNEVDYFAADKPDSNIIAKNNQALPNNVNAASANPVVKSDDTGKPIAVLPTEKAIANNPAKKQAGTHRSVYDSLMNSKVTDRVAANTESTKEKALSYSVVVQPSLGNQKFNFGTGIEVSYNLTDKISINSGIAYSSLNASTTNSNVSTIAGNVQNVNLAVSGLEVPVGVKYKTAKGFYVSAGVMGMSVMNNSIQYTYVTQGTVSSMAYDKQGLSYNALTVVSENKTQESKEKVANYLGFYILSAGKKQQIGKKNTISFGPFLRVPFGAVSTEKIRLLQGGVILGLGF